MIDIIQTLVELPSHIARSWLYPLLLIFSLIESLPIIGLFVPGQTIVMLAGFIAKRGLIDLGDAIFFSAIGAILGDLTGYFIGRKYGDDFIKKYGKYVSFDEEYYEKTKGMVRLHAGKALIIGRFTPLTRTFAPFIAGSSRIKLYRFMAFNIIGSTSWALTFIIIGYIFGGGYEIVSRYFGPALTGIFILAILGFYIYRFIKKRIVKAQYRT